MLLQWGEEGTAYKRNFDQGMNVFLKEGRSDSDYLLRRWIRRFHDDLVRDAACKQKNELQSCPSSCTSHLIIPVHSFIHSLARVVRLV